MSLSGMEKTASGRWYPSARLFLRLPLQRMQPLFCRAIVVVEDDALGEVVAECRCVIIHLRQLMATRTQLLTAEDLFRMPDDDNRDELVRGELRTMPPSGFR